MTNTQQTPKISSLAKAAMQFQVFLLRRNWMGAMGEQIMVINTIGRKTGKKHATPIGYLRDGDSLVALSNQGLSNWYKNALHTPQVTLEIKGQALPARAEAVSDPVERQKIFNLYKKERGQNFHRYFGIPVDAPQEKQTAALASRLFVRFHLL